MDFFRNSSFSVAIFTCLTKLFAQTGVLFSSLEFNLGFFFGTERGGGDLVQSVRLEGYWKAFEVNVLRVTYQTLVFFLF